MKQNQEEESLSELEKLALLNTSPQEFQNYIAKAQVRFTAKITSEAINHVADNVRLNTDVEKLEILTNYMQEHDYIDTVHPGWNYGHWRMFNAHMDNALGNTYQLNNKMFETMKTILINQPNLFALPGCAGITLLGYALGLTSKGNPDTAAMVLYFSMIADQTNTGKIGLHANIEKQPYKSIYDGFRILLQQQSQQQTLVALPLNQKKFLETVQKWTDYINKDLAIVEKDFVATHQEHTKEKILELRAQTQKINQSLIVWDKGIAHYVQEFDSIQKAIEVKKQEEIKQKQLQEENKQQNQVIKQVLNNNNNSEENRNLNKIIEELLRENAALVHNNNRNQEEIIQLISDNRASWLKGVDNKASDLKNDRINKLEAQLEVASRTQDNLQRKYANLTQLFNDNFQRDNAALQKRVVEQESLLQQSSNTNAKLQKQLEKVTKERDAAVKQLQEAQWNQEFTQRQLEKEIAENSDKKLNATQKMLEMQKLLCEKIGVQLVDTHDQYTQTDFVFANNSQYVIQEGKLKGTIGNITEYD